jgi:hypothetical protein
MKQVAEKVVRVTPIHVLNTALIAILMIGVPAVTGIDLGSLRLSSDTWLERLVVGGLALGVTGNAFAGGLLKRRRQRRACWAWMLVHAAVLLVAILAQQGWIHFDWLREFLDQLGRWAG